MALATKLITAEELLRMPSKGIELVDGEIRTMSPAGGQRGDIAVGLILSLGAYVKQHRLGRTLTAEAGFMLRRNPDTVRVPDVSFIRTERWTNQVGYIAGAPDLAIEVISPSDTYTEVNGKVLEYLQAGTQLVIVIDPGKQTAAIHRSVSETTHIDINGSLDGGDVIPGWTLPLRDLFVS